MSHYICLYKSLYLQMERQWFYYIMNTHLWHGFSFQNGSFFSFLIQCAAFCPHPCTSRVLQGILCVSYLLDSCIFCILISQQRAAVNKHISLDLLATWRLSSTDTGSWVSARCNCYCWTCRQEVTGCKIDSTLRFVIKKRTHSFGLFGLYICSQRK